MDNNTHKEVIEILNAIFDKLEQVEVRLNSIENDIDTHRDKINQLYIQSLHFTKRPYTIDRKD
jgi:hypothetical protein